MSDFDRQVRAGLGEMVELVPAPPRVPPDPGTGGAGRWIRAGAIAVVIAGTTFGAAVALSRSPADRVVQSSVTPPDGPVIPEWVTRTDDTGVLSVEAPAGWLEVSTAVTAFQDPHHQFTAMVPEIHATLDWDTFYEGLRAGYVGTEGFSISAYPFSADPLDRLASLSAEGVECTDTTETPYDSDGLTGVHITRTGCAIDPDFTDEPDAEKFDARIDLVVANPPGEQFTVVAQIVTWSHDQNAADTVERILDSITFDHDTTPFPTLPPDALG